MSTAVSHGDHAGVRSEAQSSTKATLWLAGTLALSALLYYFVGIDQGATSVFGSDTHVHEFVHDARHFLGYPCH